MRKRIPMWALALALGLDLAGSGQAQLVCQKTSRRGKIKYTLRDACRASKGETEAVNLASVANVVTARTRAFGWTSNRSFSTMATMGFERVPLDGINTGVTVNTAGASTDLVITFSARCSVLSATVGDSRGELEIYLDGVILPPTTFGNFAFCSNVEPGRNSFSMNSLTTVASNVGAGAHTIEVLAGPAFATDLLSIGGVSLTVIAIED